MHCLHFPGKFRKSEVYAGLKGRIHPWLRKAHIPRLNQDCDSKWCWGTPNGIQIEIKPYTVLRLKGSAVSFLLEVHITNMHCVRWVLASVLWIGNDGLVCEMWGPSKVTKRPVELLCTRIPPILWLAASNRFETRDIEKLSNWDRDHFIVSSSVY